MDSNSLMTMTETKMLQRVEMARFPQDLTVADKKLLAQVAITYGFDPLMGEVTIYQGRPYVSIDGRYRKAQETDKLDGVESRPATRKEREDWQIRDGDYFFRAEVYVKDASRPFVGWGRVRNSETIGGKGFKPVETNPQRMAEKRAEAQALRKAFHIPLPSVEDIGSPDDSFIDSTAVDVTTGEIAEKVTKKQAQAIPFTSEGQAREGIGEQASSISPTKMEEAPETAPKVDEQRFKRDPSTLKTITDMYKAAHADYGLQPKDVMAELNITGWQQLAITPAEAYIQIASVRKENRDNEKI